jgi:hypothetical protein
VLRAQGSYYWAVLDSWGDGLCCAYGSGRYLATARAGGQTYTLANGTFGGAAVRARARRGRSRTSQPG